MRFSRTLAPFLALLALPCLSVPVAAQSGRVSSALSFPRVKYSGGGDWYNDPSAEVNLLRFVRESTGLAVDARPRVVDLAGDDLFSYPIVFLTGHGNIALNETEVRHLRTYLEEGGFLFADDDYGMDAAFRRELKKVFPDDRLVELPFTHGLYSLQFPFPDGPPKTHLHDGKPAQGFGLFKHGRLVLFYAYESNPSDGWADAEIHNDPPEKRTEALQFGTNVMLWALTH
jgi:hypothetical protein